MSLGNMSDAKALAHYSAMIATISGDLASYPPLVAADVTASGVKRDDMSDKLLTHNQTQAAALAATTSKNMSRKEMDDDKRRIRELLKANDVAPDKYAALNFPSSGPAGEMGCRRDRASRDRRHLEAAAAFDPLRRRLRPQPQTPPIRRGRIYVKKGGTPPGNETDRAFLSLDTQTPYLANLSAKFALNHCDHRALKYMPI